MLLSAFADLSVFEKGGNIFLYLTSALAAVLLIVGLLIRTVKKEKLSDFVKYAVGMVLGYAIALIGIMLFLKFDDMIANGEFIASVFYPVLATLVTAVLLSVTALVVAMLKPEKMRFYSFIAMGIFAVPLIVLTVMYSIYYAKEIAPSGWYTGVSTLGLVISAVILIAIIILFSLLFGRKKKADHTKSIAYAALCIALSFALSYIRLFKLPQGGSITFASLLPLMLYSYLFGIRKGVVAGFIYGILQAIQDPWIIHPAQFFLDYPIAFSMIGLTGILKELGILLKKPAFCIALGGLIGGLLRYFSHVLSGIFAFAAYVGEGYNTVEWGFLYNCFALVDIAIAIVASILLLSSKSFRLFLERSLPQTE